MDGHGWRFFLFYKCALAPTTSDQCLSFRQRIERQGDALTPPESEMTYEQKAGRLVIYSAGTTPSSLGVTTARKYYGSEGEGGEKGVHHTPYLTWTGDGRTANTEISAAEKKEGGARRGISMALAWRGKSPAGFS